MNKPKTQQPKNSEANAQKKPEKEETPSIGLLPESIMQELSTGKPPAEALSETVTRVETKAQKKVRTRIKTKNGVKTKIKTTTETTIETTTTIGSGNVAGSEPLLGMNMDFTEYANGQNSTMAMPIQAPSVDRENRLGSAVDSGIDPA